MNVESKKCKTLENAEQELLDIISNIDSWVGEDFQGYLREELSDALTLAELTKFAIPKLGKDDVIRLICKIKEEHEKA